MGSVMGLGFGIVAGVVMGPGFGVVISGVSEGFLWDF